MPEQPPPTVDPRNLHVARVRRGLRQRDIAAQVGVAPQRISDFETGVRHPTPEQVSRLAEILGLTIYADPRKDI